MDMIASEDVAYSKIKWLDLKSIFIQFRQLQDMFAMLADYLFLINFLSQNILFFNPSNLFLNTTVNIS